MQLTNSYLPQNQTVFPRGLYRKTSPIPDKFRPCTRDRLFEKYQSLPHLAVLRRDRKVTADIPQAFIATRYPKSLPTPMMTSIEEVKNLNDLRNYIHQTLCARENLLPDQSGLHESKLVRSGEECGRQFTVQGPRSVRLGAIWTTEHNQVYFYGTNGERFLKLTLPQRLCLATN